MRAPTLGSNVEVLEAPKGPPRDDRVWCVWSQSPDGWWLFRRPEEGGGSCRVGEPTRATAATHEAVGELR